MSEPSVVRYYSEKTERILEKYGPGPRVHYHTGLVSAPPLLATAAPSLRAQLVAAQEQLLSHLAARWDARNAFAGRLLDVGAGLGGGSLFWAERCGSHVTALTNVPLQASLIRSFARDAGLADQVRPQVGDAERCGEYGPHDSAVAIESSCYLDRAAWFAGLARALPPGGSVHVVDCFIGRAGIASDFDAYWRTRIGTLESYSAAAEACGFRLSEREVLNPHTASFWDLSLAWTRARLHHPSTGMKPGEAARLQRSCRAHRQLRGAFLDGSIEYLALVFTRQR